MAGQSHPRSFPGRRLRECGCEALRRVRLAGDDCPREFPRHEVLGCAALHTRGPRGGVLGARLPPGTYGGGAPRVALTLTLVPGARSVTAFPGTLRGLIFSRLILRGRSPRLPGKRFVSIK